MDVHEGSMRDTSGFAKQSSEVAQKCQIRRSKKFVVGGRVRKRSGQVISPKGSGGGQELEFGRRSR